MELKLSIKPKNCGKEYFLSHVCREDRLYLPVDSDGIWDRLRTLSGQRREIVRELKNAGCFHTMALFAPALVKLTEELNELLARVDSGKEKTLELQPEVSLTVKPSGKTLTIEKMKGISILAGLPFGLQPNVVGVRLSPEGKAKVKLHKFGLEMEREL
jgi:hypothetical protein